MRRGPGTDAAGAGATIGPSLEGPRRRADPRLPAYLIAGFGALVGAIATGRPELAALAAPFVALAARGLLGRKAVSLRGRVEVEGGAVIEGDVVDGRAVVSWDGSARVEVILVGSRGVTPIEPAPVVGWSLAADEGPALLPFRVRADSWGIHDLGTLWVRARRPGSLLMWEQKLAVAPLLRVLPSPLRLQSLLKPAEPRAVAGMHTSRLRGQGTDFAELRPYHPGDRLRDLSWSTSARLGEPWVTVHHPERTGTVLLLLDAFLADDQAGRESLARAARAAWAVASVHLAAQDRVGLLALGRTAAWLPPQGGRRARWLLVEELLAVGGAAEDVRLRRRGGRTAVPADALVVGVTGLRSPGFSQDILHYRRAGHTAVVLVIDVWDLLPAPGDRADEAARRIWSAQREARRYELDRNGVPTALVTPTEGVGPAISALRRKMRSFHLLRPGVGAR